MKKIIYGLLVIGSITGSAVYSSQKTAPQRPTTGPKVAPQRPTTATPTDRLPLNKDNDTICPNDLHIEDLKKLKTGSGIDLAGYHFTLHTPQDVYNKIVPDYTKYSVAHIAKDQADKGRAFVSSFHGRILKCTYTFRTAIASKFGGDHKSFSINSEPTAPEKDLPKGLAEAIINAPETKKDTNLHKGHVETNENASENKNITLGN